MAQEDSARAAETTPLLREIEQDFNNELHAQGYDKGLWHLLKENPSAVTLLLSVFALIVLVGKSFSGLTPEMMAEAIKYELSSIQLLAMDESATAQVLALIKIDYSNVRGPAALLATFIGGMAGIVEVQFTTPLDIRVLKSKSYLHLASIDIEDSVLVDVRNLAESTSDVVCSLSNIGRSDTIKFVAEKALSGEPIDFLVAGVFKLSKWGFEYTISRSAKVTFTFANPNASLGKITSIVVGRHGDNVMEIQVTSEVDFASVVSGIIPALDWELKLPGCDERPISIVQNARSEQLDLVPGEDAFNVSLTMRLDSLPESLTVPCHTDGTKSALDRWLSRYLNGEQNLIYVAGGSDIPILDNLLSGVDVPMVIAGKSLDEKLVDQVAVTNVEIEYGSLNEVLISASVIVHVQMPAFMHLKRDLLVAVSSVRGPIYLFNEGVRMGRLDIEEWSPTVTVPQPDGFQITLFLEKAPFEVEDKSQFAKFSRELLLRGHAPCAYQTLADLSIQSPVGDLTLQGMYFQGRTELSK